MIAKFVTDNPSLQRANNEVATGLYVELTDGRPYFTPLTKSGYLTHLITKGIEYIPWQDLPFEVKERLVF